MDILIGFLIGSYLGGVAANLVCYKLGMAKFKVSGRRYLLGALVWPIVAVVLKIRSNL